MKFLNGSISSIQSAALLIGAAGLFSRLLGVLRDRLLAGHFGAGRELDIYYAAFQIPDMFYAVFLLGASSAAIIPVLLSLRSKGSAYAGKEEKHFIGELLLLFLIIALFVSVVVAVFIPLILPFTAPGFSVDERSTVALLARIMMLQPVVLGISSILSAVAQSFRKFLVFSLSAIFYNVGIIVGIIFFVPSFGLAGLALGVTLGALLHLVVQVPTFLYLIRFRGLLRESFSVVQSLARQVVSVRVRRVVALSFPRMIALSVHQLMLLVLVALASTLMEGSISVFQFAINLHYVPIGMVGLSFALAAYPRLNEYALEGAHEQFFGVFTSTLRSVLFWIVPLAVLFFVLRAHIVRVALGSGEFDWSDTRLTAAALGLLVIAVVTESVRPLLVRAFFALGNTIRPLLVGVGAALISVAGAFALSLALRGDSMFVEWFARTLRVADMADISVLGIAFAVSVGSLAGVAGLFWSLWREVGSVAHANSMKDFVHIAVGGVLAGGVAYALLQVLGPVLELDSFQNVFLQGAAAGIIGFLFYFFVLYWLGSKEVRHLMGLIRRRVDTSVLPQEVGE